MAWREKVAIFIIIFLSCAGIIFFIIGLPQVLCPKQKILSVYEVQGKNKTTDPYVVVYGRYYQIGDIYGNHVNKIGVDDLAMQHVLGQDVSQMFYPASNWQKSCPGISNPGASWDNILARDTTHFWPHYVVDPTTNEQENYLGYLAQYAKGRVGWTKEYLASVSDTTRQYIVLYNNVYNVAAYFQGQSEPGFFDDNMYKIFTNFIGKDATHLMQSLMEQDPVYYRSVLNCMNNLFYVGTIDDRASLRCQMTNWILLGASGVIMLSIVVKFLAALRFSNPTDPGIIDDYVFGLVTCYTEGKDSLENTINALATTNYDDTKKVLFLICDGMVTGGNNNKPTPDIALEILCGNEEEAARQKEASRKRLAYHAVGEGRRGENYGEVYSGLYENNGHTLPFIMVVKTGNGKGDTGNRGKRDSQVLFMRFMHHIHAGKPLTELEFEVDHQMKSTIGIKPEHFKLTLMVDSDTVVHQDSIRKLVSYMFMHQKTIGVCGETFVANEKKSITTMMQVYEYFISHHLAKAFESLFGSVTCLPGCFSMYRLKTDRNVPLLISPALIEDYGEPNLNTLHLKNLLALGEDRYLSTLLLKHFSDFETRFTPDASCRTNVPENYSILLSQRRRWINSTVHNLVELFSLGSQLCGFGCLSMRFIVLLDLVSTVVAPASVVYLAYLLFYVLPFDGSMFPIISIVMLGAIYGLQAIIFILKGEFAHIGWMILYILAIPVFSFVLPIYSFWNMDDFKWGATRTLKTEGGKEIELEADTEIFEPCSIKRLSIKDWEALRYSEENKDEDFDEITVQPDLSVPTMPTVPMFPRPAASVYGSPSPVTFPPRPPMSVYGVPPPPPPAFVGFPQPPMSVYSNPYSNAPPPISFPRPPNSVIFNALPPQVRTYVEGYSPSQVGSIKENDLSNTSSEIDTDYEVSSRSPASQLGQESRSRGRRNKKSRRNKRKQRSLSSPRNETFTSQNFTLPKVNQDSNLGFGF